MNGIAAYLCDGVRTPIGRYGGALARLRSDDLGAVPMRALLQRHPQLPPAAIEEVWYGCVNQAGEDNRNVARMSALLAQLPVTTAAATVNRLCGSGLEALGSAARAICCDEVELAIAGGVESMSRAPWVMGKTDSAFARDTQLFDSTIGWRFVNPRMRELHGVDSMGQTAENVARRYGIGRSDQDAFALRSQQRAARAQAEGRFAQEIVAVQVPGQRRGEFVGVEHDEHLRPDTTLEGLTRLRPAFAEDGSVTAGNSAGVNDGAAALLVASASVVQRYGLQPLARVRAIASVGVEPSYMGIGPVPAVRKVLALTALTMADFDVIELNEAFAAQGLAVLRELGVADDDDRVNPNGGAIALGHPLGMSGARLALTAALELRRRQGRLALCTMCIGVGQGIAMVLERTEQTA